jgi:hypothetical protein
MHGHAETFKLMYTGNTNNEFSTEDLIKHCLHIVTPSTNHAADNDSVEKCDKMIALSKLGESWNVSSKINMLL